MSVLTSEDQNKENIDQLSFYLCSDVVILQLHFTSFDYVRYILQQESFTDFLCKFFIVILKRFYKLSFLAKIGGWFSLAIGASLISFLEIFYFTFELIYQLIKREIRKKPVKKKESSKSNSVNL